MVCKSLGYPGAKCKGITILLTIMVLLSIHVIKAYRNNAGFAYGYYNYRDNRYWHCSNYANSLSDCHSHNTGSSYYDHMGVVCYENGGILYNHIL